jgi:hypothetical protein
MTGTALQTSASRLPGRDEVNDLSLLANHLARSGFFKDARGGYQALAKLVFGRDLGLSATAAMTGVHIIEGKPEISANVQAQMVKTYIGPEGERFDYKVREHDEKHCTIEFLRRWERGGEWETLGIYTYTIEDAQRAGLAGRGVWTKHPRNMLFARAMSDGVAFHCPEVTNGIRTYHEGEIDVDGSLRDAQATAEASADVPLTVIDADVIDDPGDEQPLRVSEAIVKDLVAAKQTAGKPDEWVRQQLIAIGAEHVPTGRVTLKTIRQLTEQQASDLLDVLIAETERNGGGDGD